MSQINHLGPLHRHGHEIHRSVGGRCSLGKRAALGNETLHTGGNWRHIRSLHGREQHVHVLRGEGWRALSVRHSRRRARTHTVVVSTRGARGAHQIGLEGRLVGAKHHLSVKGWTGPDVLNGLSCELARDVGATLRGGRRQKLHDVFLVFLSSRVGFFRPSDQISARSVSSRKKKNPVS